MRIETIQQAAALIGETPSSLDHDGPEQPEIDIDLLDDRRFTACGITPEGRAWLGIGHHPGPGIAAAIVVFLPVTVAIEYAEED